MNKQCMAASLHAYSDLEAVRLAAFAHFADFVACLGQGKSAAAQQLAIFAEQVAASRAVYSPETCGACCRGHDAV